jgi:hypothetical protein
MPTPTWVNARSFFWSRYSFSSGLTTAFFLPANEFDPNDYTQQIFGSENSAD